MSAVGDIYINWHEIPHLILDCKEMENKVYMFYLLDMYSGQVHTWVEPHDKQLAPSQWQYLG